MTQELTNRQRAKLIEFLQESNRIEGIHGPIVVTALDSVEMFLALERITVADMENIARRMQPDARLRCLPGMNVRVGDHIPPRGWPEIQAKLMACLDHAESLDGDAYDVHVEYETLHPFTDGNGRSGRLLWLWMMARQEGLDRALSLGFLHRFYYQALQHAR